jgi:hypothetical protein
MDYDFEHPTIELLRWLENNLSYYEQQGNEKASAIFQSLLEDARQKANIITRSASWLSSTPTRAIPRNGAIMTMLESVVTSRTSHEPEPQPHLGFLRQFDIGYQQYVENGSVETHNRIPYGFSEMIESAFPRQIPTTPENKPRVARRGSGFGNMVECAFSGTKEE